MPEDSICFNFHNDRPTPKIKSMAGKIVAAFEKNGTALSAVEALAGGKAIEKTPSGQFIMQPDGEWIPKP